MSASWPFRPWVCVERGGYPECYHEGILVVVDDEGRERARWGDPQWTSFLRSSLKMMQAIPVVESGAADAFGFGPRHLALCCASHNGEPVHVQLAREILAGAGLPESALRCGTHAPAHDESRRALAMRGEKASAIHNNCSGKHGGMLSVCVRRAWDTATYLSPEHPLQREIAGILCEFTGVNAAELTHGVDGCGVPTFRVPMVRYAHGLARYAHASEDLPHASAARRLFEAMTSHPEIVGGTGRFCTELPRAAQRPLLAKAGAEGFYVVAWREDSGRGVALVAKSAAGDSRSRDFAVTEALYQLGILDRAGLEKMAPFHGGPMKNHAGTVVGKMTSMFSLATS